LWGIIAPHWGVYFAKFVFSHIMNNVYGVMLSIFTNQFRTYSF
jgi:hypothetical protein